MKSECSPLDRVVRHATEDDLDLEKTIENDLQMQEKYSKRASTIDAN